MPLTIALRYDATRHRCDIAVSEGRLVMDGGPVTPALVGLLSHRRARPDDALPDDAPDDLTPKRLNPRRGWVGDALDIGGRRCGSRLWLLSRAKRTEATRRAAEVYAREATADLGAVEVAATWAGGAADRLALLVRLPSVGVANRRRLVAVPPMLEPVTLAARSGPIVTGDGALIEVWA
jgi:phage gp46-like protein